MQETTALVEPINSYSHTSTKASYNLLIWQNSWIQSFITDYSPHIKYIRSFCPNICYFISSEPHLPSPSTPTQHPLEYILMRLGLLCKALPMLDSTPATHQHLHPLWNVSFKHDFLSLYFSCFPKFCFLLPPKNTVVRIKINI